MAQWLELETTDGTMPVYKAEPGTGRVRGTVVVLMEAFGLTEHILDVCDRLADAGWCALAPDLYHRTAPGQTFDEARLQEALRHFQTVTADTVLTDWDALSAEWSAEPAGSVAVIGFCMGGRWSFVTACERGSQLFVACSFYGGGIERELDRCERLTVPVRLIYGSEDGLIPITARELTAAALTAVNADYQLSIYPAGHGFMCPQRDSYAAELAPTAWSELLAFLETERGR